MSTLMGRRWATRTFSRGSRMQPVITSPSSWSRTMCGASCDEARGDRSCISWVRADGLNIEDLKTMNSVNIVGEFWERVWKARTPAAIDDFVVDDFVIITGGVEVVSRTKFKEWAAASMAKINDLEFEVIETFQNEDGSRVASRWRIAGKNNGILGTPADQQPISLTGTPVCAVREDGKLCHN